MCLIVLAWRQHEDYPLLLAANRDEFHRRPTAPADFWHDDAQILAGRDLEAGGTWLGVSPRARFAAVTNIRDPQNEGKAPRSRGELTRDFLAGDAPPRDYLQDIAARRGEYLGFNLLLGDGNSLWYLHGDATVEAQPQSLEPGVYGLSNATLDVPWPKLRRARGALEATLAANAPRAPSHEELRSTVAARELASDAELQHQLLSGASRALSAQFIVTEFYGTRCQSTLRWQRNGQLEFQEQRFDPRGELSGEDHFVLETSPQGDVSVDC